MCRAYRLVAALLVALSVAGTLPAQGASTARIRSQERVLDSLVAKFKRTIRALQDFDDSVSRARVRMDTVRVGNLQMLVEPSIRTRVDRAALVASARVDSIARSGARRLDRVWIVVRTGSGSPDKIAVAFRVRRGTATSEEQRTIWDSISDSVLTTWISSMSISALAMTVDEPLQAWLHHAEVLPDTVSTERWASTRLDVVSSHATIAKRCYDGDLAACKGALLLAPVDDPVMEWYSADDRRRFVAYTRRFEDRRNPDADLCVDGADASCIAVMHGARALPDPVSPHYRMTVAKVAIRMGGAAGYERYLTATGTPGERLAFVAGAPLDSVVGEWRRSMRNARIGSRDMSPGIALSSLGWILVCGVLALRSSRWR